MKQGRVAVVVDTEVGAESVCLNGHSRETNCQDLHRRICGKVAGIRVMCHPDRALSVVSKVSKRVSSMPILTSGDREAGLWQPDRDPGC